MVFTLRTGDCPVTMLSESSCCFMYVACLHVYNGNIFFTPDAFYFTVCEL